MSSPEGTGRGALPKVLVSSVVRGSQQGMSHGGLYLVDLETGAAEQRLDWNTSGISFEGRGADRGLRGIAFHADLIYLAASDELFVFDRAFRQQASYRCAYLKHCHEIAIEGAKLFLTSTGYNSLLRFDLESGHFDLGFALVRAPGGLTALPFDPNAPGGPAPQVDLHINSVHAEGGALYIAGRRMDSLLRLDAHGVLSLAARVPVGTHNARPHAGGLLYNDTESDRVTFVRAGKAVHLPVPRYDPARLEGTGLDQSGLARQAFGRGLCPITDELIAAGSSPTTVAVHDLSQGRTIRSIAVSMDVRNAAHGLAIWPF